MKSIAHDPVKLTLACALLALLAASLIRPPYPEYLWLQHVPTALAAVAIFCWDRRWPLGRGALACTLGMLALHVVGARYIYSFVPYDEWVRTVLGVRPSEVLGLDRNHYDRLVHLAFGMLLVRPIREFLETYRGYGRRGAVVTAVLAIATMSLLYEVVEWVIAVVLSPADAQAYNGQQGDFWDAQKDMALALGGAIVAGLAQWRGGAASGRSTSSVR